MRYEAAIRFLRLLKEYETFPAAACVARFWAQPPNTNSLSDTYATIEYVDSLLVASGGVSQTDFDTSVANLQSKAIAYNNT